LEKSKTYDETRFSAETLKESIKAIEALAEHLNASAAITSLSAELGDATWSYDSIDEINEFIADYRKCEGSANCRLTFRTKEYGCLELNIWQRSRYAEISIQAFERSEIEKIFDVFEKDAAKSKLEPLPQPPAPAPIVFIGHGRNSAWRDLKDHLHDKHNIQVEAYEAGARAGHTIRDILEEMASESTFAILVFTAEDEQADGSYRARQNVIHEAGIFQGMLGFSRAILLLEEGVEQFSNVQGVQYIRFSKNNIKETFGEVLATMRREFGTQ
jgi:predicted nucleotide-binding protein